MSKKEILKKADAMVESAELLKKEIEDSGFHSILPAKEKELIEKGLYTVKLFKQVIEKMLLAYGWVIDDEENEG